MGEDCAYHRPRVIGMIVDAIYPTGHGLYAQPSIYMRTRDEHGNTHVQITNPEDEGYIRPFCWLPTSTSPRRLSRLAATVEGVRFHHEVKAVGRNGIKLYKVSFDNPRSLWDIINMTETYEAEHPWEDQILFHRFSEKRSIPDFHPRIWYFDLEWDVKEDFTTVMAVDDTHAEHPIVFAWSEQSVGIEGVEIDFIEREGGYEKRLYASEKEMHDGFLDHLDMCDPDILIAHAICWADLPHLMRRLDNPDRLSPVAEVIRPNPKTGFYRETAQPIKGRLILDTAAMGSSGSGIETLFLKSGRSLPNRKLQTIAEELGFEGKIQADEEGNKLDVKTWWRTHFDLFVDYCLVDTTVLRKVCESVNFVPYFLGMQKLCGVKISSTHNVTNYIRGLFVRETDLKSPSRMRKERDALRAANVFALKYGLLPNVSLLDFKSLYPNLIRAFNLCPTTKRSRGGEGIIEAPDGSFWDITQKGILPSVIEDLLEVRVEYKKMMEEATDKKEKNKYDMLQLAAKVNANACYGYVSQSKIGGMWTDPDVGAAITAAGRKAVDTLRAKAEGLGYPVAAGHTDSCYIQIPFNEVEEAVDLFNEEINEDLNTRGLLEVEFEAYFDYFFIGRGRQGKGKNRNFGLYTWPEHKRNQLKVTGYEHKSASASPITKEVQDIVFRSVSINENEDIVSDKIREISLKLRNGEYDLDDIAPYGRLGKAHYQGIPPMAARGMLYYNDNLDPSEPFRVGEKGQWLYVAKTPHDMPYSKSVAFRNSEDIDAFTVDYSTCVEKFIKSKIDTIYKELGWDLSYACGEKIPKKYW